MFPFADRRGILWSIIFWFNQNTVDVGTYGFPFLSPGLNVVTRIMYGDTVPFFLRNRSLYSTSDEHTSDTEFSGAS